MNGLSIEEVSKRFGDTVALEEVSLHVAPGEFITLLGASGCGKTTLLRIVAGFTRADSGRLMRQGRDISRLSPAQRRMGFVFQSYALFPTKTVAQNIGFALSIAGRRRAEREKRVRELAALVELEQQLDRYPHELSGGQQQRVALARALAHDPDLLLLDEPLSALDARIRTKLRGEIRAIVGRLGMTALYVTHDQEEALAVSDRVAVMRAGRIEQVGTPGDVYHRPRTRFVAEFVGTANLLDGRLGNGGVEADDGLWPAVAPPALQPGTPVSVLYRPEHIRVTEPAEGAIAGRVLAATFLGATLRLDVATSAGRRLVVDVPSSAGGGLAHVGAPIALRPDAAAAVVLPGTAS